MKERLFRFFDGSTHFMCTEPKFVGKFPPTQPEIKIGEPLMDVYHGGEVFAVVDGVVDETPLLHQESLWVGREIQVPTFSGPRRAVVEQGDGFLQWRDGQYTGDLVFDADDRHCWTSIRTYKAEQPWPVQPGLDLGPIPARTELTVLPADDPKERTIGFTVYELQGGEVFAIENGEVVRIPLMRREDLWEGREVMVPTLMGRCKATVVKDSYGVLYWRASEHFGGNLEFDADQRRCWVSNASYNTRGIKRLTLSR